MQNSLIHTGDMKGLPVGDSSLLPPSKTSVSKWSRLKFFGLHAFCSVMLDFVPRLFIGGPWTSGKISVHGSSSIRCLFKLDEWDGRQYPDPCYNGHVETILCCFRPGLHIAYMREQAVGGDENTICLDWFLQPASARNKGLMIIFPGLASSSSSNYIERFVWYAHQQHFHCCVVNTRGMGDTPIEKPWLMSGEWTEDLRVLLRDGPLRRQALEERLGRLCCIVGVGFSFGGLILTKYAGEECSAGRPMVFDALFNVNSPLDAVQSNANMLSPVNSIIYQANMTEGLKEYARRHAHVLKDLPGLLPPVQQAFAEGRMEEVLRNIKSIYDYDAHITAPMLGFEDPHCYYESITPLKWLPHITIPVLCISSEDDPVCGTPPLAQLQSILEKRPNIGLLLIPHGGHLGYVKSIREEWKGSHCFVEECICLLALRLTNQKWRLRYLPSCS